MLLENKLSQDLLNSLQCPVCKSKLNYEIAEKVKCQNPSCNSIFPIINAIPVLINENNSVFSIGDFIKQRNTTFNIHQNSIVKTINRIIPSLSINIKAANNYRKFQKLLLENCKLPKVLVIGGSILGQGMENLLKAGIELIDTDVSFGPRTQIICDAHDVPFMDETFDGIIIQAVLEHVVDPYGCVEEVYRVLKKGGFVYSEIPFMQQVHGGQYDFTRFTLLGQIRLFRKFEKIDAGAMCGAGMSLAWSIRYFCQSFTSSRLLKKIIEIIVRVAFFWLKYIDYVLINKDSSIGAASAYYFIGKKSQNILSDKELLKQYRG